MNKKGKICIVLLAVVCIVLLILLPAEKHQSNAVKEYYIFSAENELSNWQANLVNALIQGKEDRWEEFAVSNTRFQECGYKISLYLSIAGEEQKAQQISNINLGFSTVLYGVRRGGKEALEDLENLHAWLDAKKSVFDVSYQEFLSFLPEGFPAGYEG